jgi:hypothetical protein
MVLSHLLLDFEVTGSSLNQYFCPSFLKTKQLIKKTMIVQKQFT